jgi:hypothetical protein
MVWSRVEWSRGGRADTGFQPCELAIETCVLQGVRFSYVKRDVRAIDFVVPGKSR